ACFSFIEGWYNPVRLHSALGYRSHMIYEAAMEGSTAEPQSTRPTTLHQNGVASNLLAAVYLTASTICA
ncbi:MAG: hypothetical protein ACREFY_20060, partial [Acetobacteraceae bacterium]